MEASTPTSTSPEALVKQAAAQKRLDAEEQSIALDWFLSDEPDGSESQTRTIEINVGSPTQEKWIPWEIRAVDLDTLRRIRRQAMGNRAQRRTGGEIDEVAANLRIVVEGTVTPDLLQAAKTLGIADASEALRQRFSRKPGLLGQIAGEIMSLSGYDDEDVREAAAAGNS
jgi:hypothetical protein